MQVVRQPRHKDIPLAEGGAWWWVNSRPSC